MASQYIFQGKKISMDEAGFQASLISAYPQKMRPLCACKQPPVPMYIAKIDDRFILKRMPNTGSNHDLECRSYEIPAGLSGLDQVLGSAIKENSETGLTALKFEFTLTKGDINPIPRGSNHKANENHHSKSEPKRLSLRGTLHYLWEQAELNKWSPAMTGKRNWYIIRKYLLAAAKDKTANRSSLSALLYIPEVFELEHKDKIAQRRLTTLHSIAESGKQIKLMLIIGEVKDITTARFGFKMVIKHLPDFPILLNKDRYHYLCKVFGSEMGLWSEDPNGHLMVIGTFGINKSGTPSYEEIALMMVNENWIPYDNADELTLINSLVQNKRRFIKCLRYNLPPNVPTASVLLADNDKSGTALLIFPASSSETYRIKLNTLIKNSKINTWLWDTGHEVPPHLKFQ
ncbi:MAG: DUF1173 domain-containing protein [Methylococcaceae bacterium]|nr:DUF1173 domain-containing protein [Methylococcaceae bacterium]